jgi:hypothetical protein
MTEMEHLTEAFLDGIADCQESTTDRFGWYEHDVHAAAAYVDGYAETIRHLLAEFRCG